MSSTLTRRAFLASTTAIGTSSLLFGSRMFAQAASSELAIDRRTIEVNGKAATAFGIRNAAGSTGLTLDPDQRFAVALRNNAGEPTIVHWHGQTPLPADDGVTDTGYVAPIADGETRVYDFASRPGTHWMHSHHGLQEQSLLAAPLIVRTTADLAEDRQEVVVMLHDFTFRDPAEILASLTGGMAMGQSGMAMPGMDMQGMAMPGMGAQAGHIMSMMQGAGMMLDLNDVDYDAYLANNRTLDDPEVVRTERGGRVLLRLINGATSTAFWIDLGGATGSLVAVDGDPIVPIASSRFPMAVAQRLDIVITVPAGGTVPVLAQREGDKARTGIILAAPGAAIGKLARTAEADAAPVDLSLEARLSAVTPLGVRNADVTHQIALTGGMMTYVWGIDGLTWTDRRPLAVQRGQRVVIEMVNQSMMAHPMHLHGHHFQVVGLNGTALSGAMRDTVLVPPMNHVAIAFDADNPGRWLFHCHNLYHMATGMMTEVVYDSA